VTTSAFRSTSNFVFNARHLYTRWYKIKTNNNINNNNNISVSEERTDLRAASDSALSVKDQCRQFYSLSYHIFISCDINFCRTCFCCTNL